MFHESITENNGVKSRLIDDVHESEREQSKGGKIA